LKMMISDSPKLLFKSVTLQEASLTHLDDP
jgi:hypothetical protein